MKERLEIMDDLNKIKAFVEQADKFKQTETYKSMPKDKRDFFNEELGRFKTFIDIVFDIKQIREKNRNG